MQTVFAAPAFLDDSDTGFAWQALAGVRAPLSDNWDVGLKYRFFNADKVNLVDRLGRAVDTRFRSHSIMGSLIYNFGGAPEPVEVAPPPPPETPPPPPPPEMKAPPPPFIPPVEVQVQQPPPPQNVIAAATQTPPPTTSLAPPAPPAPSAPPAPPAPRAVSRSEAVADFNTCARPEYPRSSQRNEETGTTTLQFLIGVDGRVLEAKLAKSSGFRDLDRAAQSALSKCRFKPAMIDGKPEQAWTAVQYVWTLE